MWIDSDDDDTPRWCKTCKHYEYDSWYQGERVCGNCYSDMFGLPMDKTDTCDDWEASEDDV